jgi:outer membrane protein assembly factor BamB
MRKVLIGLACVVLIFALFGLAGFRVAVDGSGTWPRFVYRPDYASLEADRARQRQLPAPAIASAPAADPVAGLEAGPASVTAAQISEPARPESAVSAAMEKRTPGYWPDFRGPNRDGRYVETPIRTEWPAEGLPQFWKQPIGAGYASFVVADGRAFTIEQRRAQEVVAAYDIATGRELWTNGWDAEFQESMGGDGPRATPTYHEGRIYALGAEGELRCLDARTGAVLWRLNILADNGGHNLSWGMAASPLIVDDKVIVLPGGTRGQSVVAYDKTTGKPVWKAQDDTQAYTSPMLVTLGGVRQILVVSAQRAMGLTVDSGRLLWEHPWSNDTAINVAQPLLLGRGSNGNDRVFLSASYGSGAVVFELVPSGDGFRSRTLWENQRMKNKFTSSVLHQGYIYGLDESILACIDPATGEQCWKGGRYGYGQILLAGDHLVVLTEDGDLALVRAAPERHQELARFPAIEGKTWNHPVIVNGLLLVRNLQEMAAFDIRPKP